MRFQIYTPAPPLSDFVHDIWSYEGYAPSSHVHERILPSGTVEMVFNLREDELRIYDFPGNDPRSRFTGALVSGPYSKHFVSDVAEERTIVGVHFKPAGAFPFLGVPPEDLADRHVNLEQLWGRAARQVRERLCETKSLGTRFSILEKALLDQVHRPLEHHWAVPAAFSGLEKFGARPLIREIAKDLGLSQRRLIRVFATETGVTPKLFGRIQRFHRAMALASDALDPSDWSQISLRCGYYDQAHLIADFVEFSGLTPAEYLKQIRHLAHHGVRRKRNHIPVVEAA